jgi:hypothetical protein
MSASDNPATSESTNTPQTPTHSRTLATLPPFSPRTPLRKRAPPSQDSGENGITPIKDVTLASGASLIVRGVGANKKNSDPVKLMIEAIAKIRTGNQTLTPIVVKPFNPSRNDWTTTCYIHMDPSISSRTAESEPRTDLLQLWMNELAAYDPKWHVAWTPAKPGQDKRMWVRFPDLNDTCDQEAAKEKALQWAKTNSYTVCNSYFNKGGVTLTLAQPHDVDSIIQRGQVTVKGISGATRVTPGRQIEIQNPFELIVIGPLSEYEGLDSLIEQWLDEELQDNGESTLAGFRVPPNEREAIVFHMTTWAATAKVLSPTCQTAFRNTFTKYNILAPQMLYEVNTKAIYRISGNLREDFAKGADSMNKNLQNLTQRINDMEQQHQQQYQTTQLQLTAVTSSLNTMTHTIDSLENRVVNTQRAILAQSREIGLSRNIADSTANIQTLEMHIMLENNPEKKKTMENMLETMKTHKTKLQATIEDASNDFMAIVTHSVPQLTQPAAETNSMAPTLLSSPTVPPGIAQLTTRPSTAHRRTSGTSIADADDTETNALKRRRLDSEHVIDHQDEDMGSSVRNYIPPNTSKLTVAHDGISVTMMNAKPAHRRIQCVFRGVFDRLRDLRSDRHSYTSLFRSPKTPENMNLCFILGFLVIALSLLPMASAAGPTSTSTFSIYALNANGLVQPVKLNHINNAIRTLKPHIFVIGETKTQSKLSKSLPFLEYDIYEESAERAVNHHIFKWGIVMGVRKDVQIVQRVVLNQTSLKGRVIALDVVLPNTGGNYSVHRMIGTYAPWDPGGDDGTRPFWSDMTNLCNATNSSWTVAGDLNTTVTPFERLTGGQEARRQYLEFLSIADGHDLWSDNEDRTRLHDWTCRSTHTGHSAEGNIIDRVASSSSNLADSEIFVIDRYDCWIPSTDHRGIMARINYIVQPIANSVNTYDVSQDFVRKQSSKPRIKIPLKTEKDKYCAFQESVDAMIKAKSLDTRQITDDVSFIQQYEDLTEIITSMAGKAFGTRKPFKPPKELITNGAIQKIMCQIRTIGGAVIFEKSNQTHHVSLKAMKHHGKTWKAYNELLIPPQVSFLKYLGYERRKLHKSLYAERAKEIMSRAKLSDKRQIFMGLNGSTKKMIQSSNFVPLPFAINDLDDSDKLVCDPEGVKATTREYFTRLYDHTRIPSLPKPWLITKSVVEVKQRVLNDKFQWPKKATLADFRALMRRGNHTPSPGPDRWEKWTLKALSDNALSLILDLHNYEVMNSCFPGKIKDLWLTTIYKKGLHTDLRNWRGLCFSNFLANSPMTWLNQCLIKYAAEKHILPDTQVAAQPGVQTRDLMSYLAGVKCWATRHKQPVYAIKRDQMKGFDYLSPDGFYDAIRAYGLPSEIIDIDRAAQHEVKCFIQTAYGATIPITISGVSKQGGPISPLKSTFTTSMGHYYLCDELETDKDALIITSSSKERKDPHTSDADRSILIAMVEATDDSYIFSKSIESLQRNTLTMERFQYAYGWLTNWTKSNAYILAPTPGITYDNEIMFDSVSTAHGVDPMVITKHTVIMIKDDMDFLRAKVDNPTARFNELKQFIDNFQFPTVIGRLPITIIRKLVAQNIVSKCRALLSLQPIMPPDASKLDRLIMRKVHETLGFPFQPSTDIATLPIALHGFGFPSISRINACLSVEGLHRDLNHHIPAYRDMALITLADWTCEKAGCDNPIDGMGLKRNYGRQLKSIPAGWIIAQKSMAEISLSLKRTDQSDLTQGDVSISHIVSICNHKIPHENRTVNGNTMLSLKKKNITSLKDIGKWIIDQEGNIKIDIRKRDIDSRWTQAAKTNWTKFTNLLDEYLSMDDLTRGMPDLAIPRDVREQRAQCYIQALARTSGLPRSTYTDGKTWATDGSMLPASAGTLDPKTITGAATGTSSLVMRVPGRNVSILHGEQLGLIVALLVGECSDEHQTTNRILTDHLNSVRLIDDSQSNISQVPRLRFMNGRSYYRWILSTISRRFNGNINITYTPGHSNDSSTDARMNAEADHLASASQKCFKDLPEAPPPTFHMNDFTFHHSTDGWIESNITQYIGMRMEQLSEMRLRQTHGQRIPTWVHDSNPPPEYPYSKATSAHSAAIQLYARSGQLATADILKKRNLIDDDQCRLGCAATESPRHIFLKCPQYETWRNETKDEVVRKTELKVETMEIKGPTKESLIRAAKSLFVDDELVWPLHASLYYLGQIPSIDNLLKDSAMTAIQKLRIKSHISADWHTSSIRLAGRIFGDFQKRVAVLNDCPRR